MSNSDHYDDAPNATAKDTRSARTITSRAVTVNKPVSEVFAFFRDLSNAPLYMEDVESVTLAGTTARWTGTHGSWESEITHEVPEKEISWQAEDSAGRATFAEIAGRGTVVTLTMAYEQGYLAKVIDKLTQNDPGIRARRDLRRFKQLLETGEIATNARNRRMLAEEKN